MMVVYFFFETQRGPAPYTRRRAMQRSKLVTGGADAGAGGMSISSGSGCASGMGASSSPSVASAMASPLGLRERAGCYPTPGAPTCRDERPISCAWARGPLTKEKKRGDFLLQEYFRRGNKFVLQFFLNSEKSTPGEIFQILQFYTNSKTIKMQRVKSVIIFAKMVHI